MADQPLHQPGDRVAIHVGNCDEHTTAEQHERNIVHGTIEEVGVSRWQPPPGWHDITDPAEVVAYFYVARLDDGRWLQLNAERAGLTGRAAPGSRWVDWLADDCPAAQRPAITQRKAS